MAKGKKLSWDDVEAIRRKHSDGFGVLVLADEYGVSRSTISNVVHGRTWKGSKPSPLKGRKTGRSPANKTVASENLWKRKKREAKLNPRSGGTLTIDQYNACYEAYVVRQSGNHVAKSTGINLKTAIKYINEGDPKRNLRPLKDRFMEVVQRAQDKQDFTLEIARTQMQGVARALLARMSARITAMDPSELDADGLAAGITKVQGVIERTLGVADQTVKIDGSKSRFDTWTDEELFTFFETGKRPDHDILSSTVSKTKGVQNE